MSRLLCLAELLRHVRRDKRTRSCGSAASQPVVHSAGRVVRSGIPSTDCRIHIGTTSCAQVIHRGWPISRSGALSTGRQSLSTPSQQLAHKPSTGCPQVVHDRGELEGTLERAAEKVEGAKEAQERWRGLPRVPADRRPEKWRPLPQDRGLGYRRHVWPSV